MKSGKILSLLLALLVIAACGGSASDLIGTSREKNYQVQGINNGPQAANIVRLEEQVGLENEVLSGASRELNPVFLSFDHPLHERRLTYVAFENGVEQDRVEISIFGQNAEGSEDWIILRWDGDNLTAGLANDPQ